MPCVKCHELLTCINNRDHDKPRILQPVKRKKKIYVMRTRTAPTSYFNNNKQCTYYNMNTNFYLLFDIFRTRIMLEHDLFFCVSKYPITSRQGRKIFECFSLFWFLTSSIIMEEGTLNCRKTFKFKTIYILWVILRRVGNRKNEKITPYFIPWSVLFFQMTKFVRVLFERNFNRTM